MWNLNVKSQKPESVVRVHDQGQGSVGQWHGFVRCRSPIPARHETSWRQLHCDCPRPRPDLVGWKGWGLINYIKPSQSQIIVSMCFWWVWWAKKRKYGEWSQKTLLRFFPSISLVLGICEVQGNLVHIHCPASIGQSKDHQYLFFISRVYTFKILGGKWTTHTLIPNHGTQWLCPPTVCDAAMLPVWLHWSATAATAKRSTCWHCLMPLPGPRSQTHRSPKLLSRCMGQTGKMTES